jgi:hypothetical protein
MKEIKGYEGKYAIDEEGNVWSLNYNRTGEKKKMKQSINTRGYKYVQLYNNGKGRLFRVHRLLAQAYLPDYCEDLQVDHIDRDKNNNKLTNLRMVTASENQWNNNGKGYYWNKQRGKYHVQIRKDKKTHYLGSFDNKEEARSAYLSAKKELHIL